MKLTKKFILTTSISLIIGVLILSQLYSPIRNYDYNSLPISTLEPKEKTVVKIQENITNNQIGKYQYQLDKNINCIPTGNKKVAGYWKKEINKSQFIEKDIFVIMWVIDGC